jgi:hypothetical protein
MTALALPCTSHTLVLANTRGSALPISIEIEGVELASVTLDEDSVAKVGLDLVGWNRPDGTLVAVLPAAEGTKAQVPIAYVPSGPTSTLLHTHLTLVVTPTGAAGFTVPIPRRSGLLDDPILHALGLYPVSCADRRLLG